MQTRAPLDISPAPSSDYCWDVSESGQADMTELPNEAPLPLQAFRSNGIGGMEIAIGEDPKNDPVWEYDSATGGIKLRMAA